MTSLGRHIIGVNLILLSTIVNAQVTDTIASENNKTIRLPEIGINIGIINLFSDVSLNAPGPSPFTQFGLQLSVTQPVGKFLNLTLNIFSGTVYGDEQRGLSNLNFKSSLFSQQLNIEYNFYPLLKPEASGRQLLRPYIGFGGGAMFFRSKGDLRSTSGEPYYYWADGTIRNIAEGGPNSESATILTRDLEYETDLRDANLDGLRKYPQTTFTLPFHAGIRFQISKHLGANLALTYALNFSEMIDNSGSNSTGDRASTSGYDHHFFGSIGVNVFLGNMRPSASKTSAAATLAQSQNRWKSKPSNLNSEVASTTPNGKITTEEKSEIDTNSNALVKVTNQDLNTRVQKQVDETSSNGVDSTQALSSESNLDSNKAESDQKTPSSLSLAYRADGTIVKLVSKEKTAIDGTPIEELYDIDGNALNKETAENLTIAFKADGKAIELVTKGIAAADGTPLKDLLDINGRPLSIQQSERKSNLGYTSDGKPVELLYTGFVGSDGTSIDQLLDIHGNSLNAESASRLNLAYRKDGKAVAIVPKEVSAVNGTSIEKLLDENGNPLSIRSIPTIRIAYRADGKPVEIIVKSVIGVDGTPINQLFDSIGVPLNQESAIGLRFAYSIDEKPVDLIPESINTTNGTPVNQLYDINGNPLIMISSGNVSTKIEQSNLSNYSSSKPLNDSETPSSNSLGTLTLSELEKTSPKATGSFHWADRDKNGKITATEVLYFIDSLFDGDGSLSVEDIQNLIDYYFDQE